MANYVGRRPDGQSRPEDPEWSLSDLVLQMIDARDEVFRLELRESGSVYWDGSELHSARRRLAEAKTAVDNFNRRLT